MKDLDAEQLLDLEQSQSEKLADVLALVLRWAADKDLLHAIAVQGSQVTLGDVAQGRLALYERHRREHPIP